MSEPWFETVQEVRAAMDAQGYKWWTPGSMRFFNTELVGVTLSASGEWGGLFGGRVFVTRERPDESHEWGYTVRLVARDQAGKLTMDTAGEFLMFDAAEPALRAAREVGSWAEMGVIPDELEYGQDIALGVALADLGFPVEVTRDTDGWVFLPAEGGFRKLVGSGGSGG